MMKRHPFKTFPLVFGVMLILLAGWIALPSGDWWWLGIPRWLLPVAAMLAGGALIIPLFTLRAEGEQPPGRQSDTELSPDGGMTSPGEGRGADPAANPDPG